MIRKIVFLAIVVIFYGCDTRNTIPADRGPKQELGQSSPALEKVAQTELSNIKDPVDYGNGVYYFDSQQAAFAVDLSSFLRTHTCKIEGITGDGSSAYGSNRGYFVVCR